MVEYDKEKHGWLTKIDDIGHAFAKKIVDKLHEKGVDHTDQNEIRNYMKDNPNEEFYNHKGHNARINKAFANYEEKVAGEPEQPQSQPQPEPEPERRREAPPKQPLPYLKILMFTGLGAVLLLLASRFFGFLGSNLINIIIILGFFG